MKHESTKTFGHDMGLSACFRQHRALSHCSQLHGYALSFTFRFGAEELDANNWVMDFGGLKKLKAWLVEMFDHTLVVAEDDPQLDYLASLQGMGLARVVVLPSVGCEAFARMAFMQAQMMYENSRIKMLSCEVREHGANSAIYKGAWL